MNKLKTNLNPITLRLCSFIESVGGVTVVADKVGRNPQTFYSYNRGIMPSLEVLAEVKSKFPELDLNWLATGSCASNLKETELLQELEETKATMNIFKQVALSKM